jgi:hypothetical protein
MFAKKYRELLELKISVFLSQPFIFSLNFFASSLFKSVIIYVMPRMGQNFDDFIDYPDFQQKVNGM